MTGQVSALRAITGWLTTTDHKRIGLLYLGTITVFFVLGGLIATVMRIELATAAADLVSAETYNRLFTLHGVIMVWFFLIPSIPTFLGNYLVPLMLGARELAFPRLNLASWYVFVAGGALTLAAMIGGGIDTGWTFYTPYSTTFSESHVLLAVLEVQRASYGVSGAARAAARAYSLAPDEGSAPARARAAAAIALRDQRVDPDQVELAVECRPIPGNCLAPGSLIRIELRHQVRLPLAPDGGNQREVQMAGPLRPHVLKTSTRKDLVQQNLAIVRLARIDVEEQRTMRRKYAVCLA